ncbi:hypothetical protein BC834DRAFT_1043994, partial [Gloeopeniophorella convolvens]
MLLCPSSPQPSRMSRRASLGSRPASPPFPVSRIYRPVSPWSLTIYGLVVQPAHDRLICSPVAQSAHDRFPSNSRLSNHNLPAHPAHISSIHVHPAAHSARHRFPSWP